MADDARFSAREFTRSPRQVPSICASRRQTGGMAPLLTETRPVHETQLLSFEDVVATLVESDDLPEFWD